MVIMVLKGGSMLNQVILIGRLTSDPVIKVLEDGKKVSDMRLAVQRSFKNVDGTYETDFITITLWQGLAESLNKYCTKGTLVAVRARLQTRHVTHQEKDYYTVEVIGERVSYLSSGKKEATMSEEDTCL